MEAGTLDFEDLMDTGDEYPGFGIEKFSSANGKDGDDDDSVLRTPEHKAEDDDFMVAENKDDAVNGEDKDHATSEDDGSAGGDTGPQPGVDLAEADDGNAGGDPGPQPGVDLAEADESAKEDVQVAEASGIEHKQVDGDNEDEDKDENKDEDNKAHQSESPVNGETDDKHDSDREKRKSPDGSVEEEPALKKKKYLQVPKPRMKLWGGRKDKEVTSPSDKLDEEEEKQDLAKEDHDQSDNGEQRDEPPEETEGGNEKESQENNSTENEKKKDAMEEKVDKDEDDPHQQSFLSFLNLKPGMSKSTGEDKKKEKAQEQDFYSRKRLRTRKKVSYVEDVKENSDDDYNEDDEVEDEEDHLLNVRSPNMRRSRTNSGKSPGKVPNTFAAANYAKALQNISSQYSHLTTQQAAQVSIQQQKAMAAAKLSMQQKTVPLTPNKLLQMPNLVTDLTGSNTTGSGGVPGQIKGLFECGLCGTFFNTASQFISHQEIAHAEENKRGKSGMETFRCEICQFVLTNRFAYLEHKRMKHMKSQVSFSCSKCGKNFAYLLDMQKHKETCGGGTAPWCGQCNARFKNMQELQLHRNKVHGTPSTRQWLNCVNKSCSFKCLTQHEMKIHIQNKHMINELFPCNAPRCARIFSTREQLNEHKKEAHASEFIVQYQCMECKMCYSSKTLLAEHQYLHTMDKLRKCDICMRQFNTSGQLKKHKEVHACKGTEQCTACTRWCVDKQELVSHVCAERRGRPIPQRLYFCDICHKDFKADEPMFVHRKEHKKYYQCGTCLWECSNEADYFEHREVHGMFTCKECCEEISSETELEAHEKAHQFYIKLEEQEEDGKNQPVMYLCPNLLNAIKA